LPKGLVDLGIVGMRVVIDENMESNSGRLS
jgi:hypothetical protein